MVASPLAFAHVATFAAGLVIVFATWQSIIATIILPRRTRNWIAALAWLGTHRVIAGVARRLSDLDAKDRILALLGPVNIVLLLFVWLGLFVAGFALAFYAFGDVSFGDAIDLSGSSMLTLGFATAKTALARFVMFAAAASGMIVVGLQIGYLPAIYAAYSQRESLVTLLNMRCQESGSITGRNVLEQHPLPASEDLLRSLFASWEACAAAIVESHTNYPWLIVFRSPRASESWITSMLAMLDAATLLDVADAGATIPEARHCRFACAVALRELAGLLRPKVRRPQAPVPLRRGDVEAALATLAPAVASARDPDDVWNDFVAARAEYEAAALDLGAFVSVRDAGWLRPVEAGRA